MAAASPNAVASSASAMPGATTARLVVCSFEMPMKLFMMPHTVPNRPTNGAKAPPDTEKLQGLGKPNGPGQHRSEDETEHHGLHDDVRRHEHAIGRQISWQ